MKTAILDNARRAAAQRRGAERRVICSAAAAAAVLTVCASTASAHHSFAMFDQSKAVTLEGTLKELQWTNPHIWVQVIAKDPASGQNVEWSIEGGSPNGLKGRGWTRTMMKPGDQITIVIHPLKSGEHGGSLMKVTVNGKTVG
jgi:hypothetical protein